MIKQYAYNRFMIPKLSLIALSVIAIFLFNNNFVLGDSRENKPLRALLYCYLPAMQPQSLDEFEKLSLLINTKLQQRGINIVVDTCDSTKDSGNSSWLYDPSQINKFFDTYDIIQLDYAYISKITQKLLLFSKDQIDYYDDVFEFEWKSLEKGDKLTGSPGLLCSNFKETRINQAYENRLVAKFKASSAYDLMALYMSEYLNAYTDKQIQDFDYSGQVDSKIIALVANYLKDCQQKNSYFDYQNNWCLQSKTKDFFSSKYSSTIGYSQNLFNFLKNNIKQQEISIEHMIHGKSRKLFYMDPFIAKEDSNRKTVLQFYKFMLSDQILDIYVRGQYTKNPKTTYLLPPTKSYMKKMINSDPLYKQIYQSGFTNSEPMVVHQAEYTDNLYTYAQKIDKALKQYTRPSTSQGGGEL